MRTNGKTGYYCAHCGYDTDRPDKDGNSALTCPSRDGDFCAPRKRTRGGVVTGTRSDGRLIRAKATPRITTSVPRKALEVVIALATCKKFAYGDSPRLKPDDVAAILKVCAAFQIEAPANLRPTCRHPLGSRVKLKRGG